MIKTCRQGESAMWWYPIALQRNRVKRDLESLSGDLRRFVRTAGIQNQVIVV